MLLDTNFLIDLLNGEAGAVALARTLDSEGGVLRIPSPALFELWVGAQRSVRKEAEAARIDELVRSYEVEAFTWDDARSAGALQAMLIRAGTGLGTIDALLAGMAIARKEPLVTGDAVFSNLGPQLQTRTYRRA